jgi:hypothetical protein
MCFNDDSDLNEIDESESQLSKQFEQRISTSHGLNIDSSFERENAPDSMRFNDDSDSNKTDESDSQHEKNDDPRILI